MVISTFWSGVIGLARVKILESNFRSASLAVAEKLRNGKALASGSWLLTLEEKFVADRISVVRRRRFE
jgi:hypothetical protein